ncbi:MAG: crotonase/enoyl-CoA hydratase family protein [bacterium]
MSVRVDQHGAVTVITLDRPEVKNAVDGPTAHALHAAFSAFEADDAAHVAVLTGAGGTFCAGADLKAIPTPRRNPLQAEGVAPMGPSRMELDKPVIAAIEGHAVAGGLELALWCDLRVVAQDAVLGVFCRRWGVPLIDGGTVRLPAIIGLGRALDLILTGRAVGADEALAMGLANRISAPGAALDDALRLAQEISRLPQACLRADRRSARSAHLDPAGALAREFAGGLSVLPGAVAGAARFAAGAGRHGQSES